MREIRFGLSPGSLFVDACVGQADWVDELGRACRDGRPGLAADVLLAFQAALASHFRFRLVHLPLDGGFAKLRVVEPALAKGHIDIAADLWAWTLSRSERLGYPAAIVRTTYFFFVNEAALSSSSEAIHPMNTSFGVLGLILAVTILTTLGELAGRGSRRDWAGLFLELSGMWVHQAGPGAFAKGGLRLGFALLAAFFALFYNDAMKTGLLPSRRLPFNGRDGLGAAVGAHRFSIVTNNLGNSFYHRLWTPSTDSERRLNHSLTVNPPKAVTGRKALQLVSANPKLVTDNIYVPPSMWIPHNVHLIRDSEASIDYLFLLSSTPLPIPLHSFIRAWCNVQPSLLLQLNRLQHEYGLDGQAKPHGGAIAAARPEETTLNWANLSLVFRLLFIGLALGSASFPLEFIRGTLFCLFPL